MDRALNLVTNQQPSVKKASTMTTINSLKTTAKPVNLLKAGLLGLVAGAGFGFIAIPAKADEEYGRIAQKAQSCENAVARGMPSPGTACVHRLTISTARADWGNPPEKTSNEASHSAGKGWVITHVSSAVSTGSQQGSASTQFVQGGEVSYIKTENDTYSKELRDYYNKINASATVPVEGVPLDVKGMLETIEKEQKEVEQRSRYTASAQSNVDKVILKANASGRCFWTIPLSGKCGDGIGGWYNGYVDVYKVYVGTPEDIKSERASMRQTFNNWISQIERSKPNTPASPVVPGKTPGNSPSMEEEAENEKPETENEKPETENEKPETENEKPF